MREVSFTSVLRRVGFVDPIRAESLLADSLLQLLNVADHVEDFSKVPDPDACVLALLRLTESCRAQGMEDQLEAIMNSAGAGNGATARQRLLSLLGMSSALGDFLITHPQRVREVEGLSQTIIRTTIDAERAAALRAVGADPDSDFPVATLSGGSGINALRANYFTRICAIAEADLTASDPLALMPAVGGALSDVVAGALEAALAVARTQIEGAENVGLTIVAMGKTGARELNYISDVDVVYVARALNDDIAESEMLSIATKLATWVGKAVSAPSGESALWILDAALRPEGKDGPLVRTLESHISYYRRWAQGWEFQALLKARPVAGDRALGEAYLRELWPLVWKAAERENFVEESRAMRKRVEDNVPPREENRQLKLGKGGLRDVEFTVQLLQLVHGRADKTLRVRATLDALAALRDGGYVARKDADMLDSDYRFLRCLEHRIQLQRLRRSHLVPTNTSELRRIARSFHRDDIRTAEDLEQMWQRTRLSVRQLHQEIYYRPLLPYAARLSADDISLERSAAIERLKAIGYRDPNGALANILALTTGVSRTAAIQRQLLPVMLGWFATGPEPDAGLLAFRVLSEKMGRTSWYMRTLRDGGAAAERLCIVLSSSRYLAEQIPELPESISWLQETRDLEPRSREELDAELDSMLERRSDPSDIAMVGRYLRRRELLRTGLGQVLHIVSPIESRAAVSCAAEIAIAAGLRGAIEAAKQKYGSEPLSSYLVVAMGRLGGREMGYASDADVIFVHEPFAGKDDERAARFALDVAANLKNLLEEIGSELPLPIDFDLRPEGRQGVLTRTLSSYAEYYERWAEIWERQSLLRARPIAGDAALAQRFIALIDPYRYPVEGISERDLREVRRIKARVEAERMPRGVSPHRHLKLGRGGLADVEWTAQLLQMQYAGQHAKLRVTSTLGALAAAADEGLIARSDADQLSEAWNMASELRDVNFLGTGRSSSLKIDVLPHNVEELAVVAFLLEGDVSERHDVEERYLRAARRARSVVERILFGREPEEVPHS
ncbi:MAG: bifunctional [glutamine synthetase] adenylyltransferase/[glutamine synthetase]-adenylyl-L-tyrosine phosphorylase [Ancrocorticia sp.]|jgi:glutamate-ammonia-ligase adenylyltransferase|nr:bifunctional [glutamine synthetase] adenylyltransferase/[glutamine synthetase]-adenylyl-L-tyrosine phosphorylase [Ancrocorticia sp.]